MSKADFEDWEDLFLADAIFGDIELTNAKSIFHFPADDTHYLYDWIAQHR